MSNCPSAVESNAIRVPSGDQRGVVTLGPPKVVNWIAFAPLLSHIQISSPPERADIKAILLLSGEYCGARLFRVEEINGIALLRGFKLCTTLRLGLVGAAIRQMELWKNSCA